MNQILQFKNTKQHKPIDIKKVLLFLVIIIAILGLGVLYINIKNGNIKLPTFKKVPEKITTITLTPTDRNKLIINVESEAGVSNLSYILNNQEIQIIDFEGETTIEKTLVEIPIGEHTISVSVIDVEGKETTKQESFVVEQPKPVIDLSVVGNNIKIIINSEIELSEITYKWNSDSEKKENMKTYENKTSFEKKIDIPVGTNTLTVTATDINGGNSEKIQEIKGVTKATTTTKVEGQYLHFTVKGQEEIEKVEFTFNGKKYLMNVETFGKTKKVHYKVKLTEGMNYLTITSTTQSGGTDTTSYEQEYTKK